MVAAVAMADTHFAHSESHAVGTHGHLMDGVKSHAENVVGGASVSGDGMFFASSAATMGSAEAMTALEAIANGPLFIAASVFMVASRMPMLLHHQHELTDEELAKELAEDEKHKDGLDHVFHQLGKAFKPGHNPVESTAMLGLIAGGFWFGAGALTVAGAGLTMMGVLDLAIGTMMLTGHTRVLLDDGHCKHKTPKQKKPGEQDALNFAQSESKNVGATGWLGQQFDKMKESPTYMHGVLGTLATCLMVVKAGFMIAGAGLNPVTGFYAAATALYLASTITYTAFIHKHAEVAKDEAKPGSHTARILAERGETKPRDPREAKTSFAERISQERNNDSGLQRV